MKFAVIFTFLLAIRFAQARILKVKDYGIVWNIPKIGQTAVEAEVDSNESITKTITFPEVSLKYIFQNNEIETVIVGSHFRKGPVNI